jgi:hypothetical protein
VRDGHCPPGPCRPRPSPAIHRSNTSVLYGCISDSSHVDKCSDTSRCNLALTIFCLWLDTIHLLSTCAPSWMLLSAVWPGRRVSTLQTFTRLPATGPFHRRPEPPPPWAAAHSVGHDSSAPSAAAVPIWPTSPTLSSGLLCLDRSHLAGRFTSKVHRAAAQADARQHKSTPMPDTQGHWFVLVAAWTELDILSHPPADQQVPRFHLRAYHRPLLLHAHHRAAAAAARSLHRCFHTLGPSHPAAAPPHTVTLARSASPHLCLR